MSVEEPTTRNWLLKRFGVRPPRWQLAIFDWNGTLLNDLPLTYRAVQAIFEHYKVPPPSLETYRAEISSNFLNFYHNRGIPRETTVDDLNSIRREYFSKNHDGAFLNPGAKYLLRALRAVGLQTAIVSGEMAGYLEKRTAEFGVRELFHKIRDGACDKEAALAETLAFFNVEAKRAFYVDDTVDGNLAARKLGITTFGFLYSGAYHSEERVAATNPDFPIKSLGEVLAVIANNP